MNRRAAELQLHVTNGARIAQLDQVFRKFGFRQTGGNRTPGLAAGAGVAVLRGRGFVRSNGKRPSRAFGRGSRGRRLIAPRAMGLLVTLCVLLVSGCSVETLRVMVSGEWPPERLPPDPITLGVPQLSPDGKLVALGVNFDEFLPRLVVFDLEDEELVVVDRPDNEGWLSPSFSPSGDRIVFIRYCVEGCGVGRTGFQVSILDRKSRTTTMVTQGRKLWRQSPIFSPDGQSIVFAAENLVWKDDFLARGLGWRDGSSLHSSAGRGTLWMIDIDIYPGFERNLLGDSERFGVTQFGDLYPAGFLDENTLVFWARHPMGDWLKDSGPPPLFRELARQVGEDDAKYGSYGYRLTLGEKLEFISPDAPRTIGRTSSLSVSSDTGRMAFTGFSGRDPDNRKYLGYDVFLGDGRTFRPVTSLLTYIASTVISKSGTGSSFSPTTLVASAGRSGCSTSRPARFARRASGAGSTNGTTLPEASDGHFAREQWPRTRGTVGRSIDVRSVGESQHPQVDPGPGGTCASRKLGGGWLDGRPEEPWSTD